MDIVDGVPNTYRCSNRIELTDPRLDVLRFFRVSSFRFPTGTAKKTKTWRLKCWSKAYDWHRCVRERSPKSEIHTQNNLQMRKQMNEHS